MSKRRFFLPPEAPLWLRIADRVTGMLALAGWVIIMALLVSGAMPENERLATASIAAVAIGVFAQFAIRLRSMLKWVKGDERPY